MDGSRQTEGVRCCYITLYRCGIGPSHHDYPTLHRSGLDTLNVLSAVKSQFRHAFRIRLNLLHMAGTERADTVRADAVWTVKGIKGRFIQLQVSHSLPFKSETPNTILLT